jgi:hypothetical protein
MLSSSTNKARAITDSFTTGWITTTLSQNIQLGGGGCLCIDGNELLYAIAENGSTTGFFTINPRTGVTTGYSAGGIVVTSLAVTFSGVVFMTTSAGGVYATGGSYGSFSTSTNLFTVANGVFAQALAVDDAGLNVYIVENTGGYFCKFNAWSGGTATRTVLAAANLVNYPYRYNSFVLDQLTGNIYLSCNTGLNSQVGLYTNGGSTVNSAWGTRNIGGRIYINIDNKPIVFDGQYMIIPNSGGDSIIATPSSSASVLVGMGFLPSRINRSYYSIGNNNPNNVTIFPSGY